MNRHKFHHKQGAHATARASHRPRAGRVTRGGWATGSLATHALQGAGRARNGARAGLKQIRVPSDILIGHVPSVHHKRGAPAVARAPDRPRVRILTRGGWATKPPAARARQSSGAAAMGAALGKNRAKKPQKPKLERAARNRGRARCRVGVPYDFGPQTRAKGGL